MKYIKEYYLFFLLLTLGFIIRLIFIAIPGFKIDVDDWFAWSIRLQEVGFSHFYTGTIFSDYPPGYMYILGLLVSLKEIFHLSTTQYYNLLKIPAILAETVLATTIFFIVKKERSLKGAYITSAFILFNPALIFITAIWGQIDALLGLLLVLSVYCLKNKKLIAASTLFTLAFLMKPQAIAIGPVFLFYLLRHFNKDTILSLTIPGIITVIILPFPFFPTQPIIAVLSKFLLTAAEYPYTSLFAYNIWGIVGFWVSDTTRFLSLTYQSWSIIIFSLYWIFLAYLYFKKRLDLYSLSALALLGFYFLPTRVHERYLYPAIPFLILSASEIKSTILLIVTGIASLIFFCSLYYVYIYYNVIYFHISSILMESSIYTTIQNNGTVLSMFMTLLFILFTFIIAKHTYSLPKHAQK